MVGDVVTFGSIATAVASTLKGVRSSWTSTPLVVQNYNEISEAVNDWPLLRVLPKSGKVDAFGSNTERLSFGGKIQTSSFTLEILGYAKQRSELKEDLAAQMALIDAIDVVLSSQKGKPQFGMQAIQGFNWSWEKTTFADGTGDGAIQFAGATITLEVFIF